MRLVVADDSVLLRQGVVAVLQNAGFDALSAGVAVAQERYADGTTYCHREYPYRPDFKMLGSYTLPLDILISGTYQFTRGVQTGGAGPAILASWSVGATTRSPPRYSSSR